MSIWNKIGYLLLLGWSKATGALPDWFLYGFMRWVLYGVLYRVARYRVRIVRENLANAFPEKSPEERRRIEKEFYKHLAEVFIDTIDMSSISRRHILKRIRITNLEEHEARTVGRDWFAAMAHYGSWEYFSAYQLLTRAQVGGVYRPLHSKVFDAFYKKVRTRFGMEVISMKSLLRYIARHKAEANPECNIAVGLIADQTPLPPDINMWFDFLNQPTPFFEGMERLAVRFGMPIYFLHLRKVGVARYEGRFEQIYDGVSPVEPYSIIATYAALLEREIREQPAYWMWSHRRWKRKPEHKPEVPHYHVRD